MTDPEGRGESVESPSSPPRPRRERGGLLRLWSVPTYRFASIFSGLLVATAFLYPKIRPTISPALGQLEIWTAVVVYHVLDLVSSEAELSGDRVVAFHGFPVKIIDECTGIYEAFLLSAAVLAYPTSWKKTLLGFAIGIPMIYLLNVARIVSLLVVGHHSRESFEFTHVYFWQVTMVVMVTGTWLVWLRWVVGYETPPPAPA